MSEVRGREMNFRLSTIKGTERYVEQELLKKFPESSVQNSKPGEIAFEEHLDNIDKYRRLCSPLRISDESGKTINTYRRSWRKTFVPAGINPALAYILCQIAELEPDDTVLDPFCGSGTIPISACLYFGVKKAFASDVSGRAIDACLTNKKTAGLADDKLVVFRSNISMIKLSRGSVDKVVTNMPFGIRAGNHEKNVQAYESFAQKLKSLLTDNGRAVILTQEKKLLKEKLSKDFDVKLVAIAEQGGLKPGIFEARKKAP